jgi:hypothetical protein
LHHGAIGAPVRQPLRDELHVLRHVAAAREDPVAGAALDSLEASDVPDTGVEPLADLASWFATAVAPRVARVALVPDQDAGLLSHLTSHILPSSQFARRGMVEGDDVLSTLARAEYYMNEKDLESAARELNQLKGTARVKHLRHRMLDGNITIRANTTQFKRHRLYPAQHSAMFAGAFAGLYLGAAASEEDVEAKGSRVYIITGLIAHVFAAFLGVLSRPRKFSSSPPQTYSGDDTSKYIAPPPHLTTTSSFLRASTALPFPPPRSWAIKYLSTMRSPNLSEFKTAPAPFVPQTVLLAREAGLVGC